MWHCSLEDAVSSFSFQCIYSFSRQMQAAAFQLCVTLKNKACLYA